MQVPKAYIVTPSRFTPDSIFHHVNSTSNSNSHMKQHVSVLLDVKRCLIEPIVSVLYSIPIRARPSYQVVCLDPTSPLMLDQD